MHPEAFVAARNTGEIIGTALALRISVKPLSIGARPLPEGAEMRLAPGRKLVVFTSHIENDALQREAAAADAEGEISALLIEADHEEVVIMGPAYIAEATRYEDLCLTTIQRRAERLIRKAPKSPDVLYKERHWTLVPQRRYPLGLFSKIFSDSRFAIMTYACILMVSVLLSAFLTGLWGVAITLFLFLTAAVLGGRYGQVSIDDPSLLNGAFFRDVVIGERVGIKSTIDPEDEGWTRERMAEETGRFLEGFSVVRDAIILLPEEMFRIRPVKADVA